MKTTQQLILECLAEEAAEVIQAKSKCPRFGLDDYHPKEPNKTNEQLLIEECADFLVCMEALELDPFVWHEFIEKHKQKKRQKLVNRHPAVFGPIFNLAPEVPDTIGDLLLETNEEPTTEYFDHPTKRYKPVCPGDVSYGSITGHRYVAERHRDGLLWHRREEA